MKLQVGKAQDGTWYYRCRVNGRITAHGADYNSKGGATTAVISHVLQCVKLLDNLVGVMNCPMKDTAYWKPERKALRKAIEYV